jgi:hypothetical protein
MRMACSTGQHEDLAVADLAGLGGVDDRLDGGIDLLVGEHHLDLDLRQEVDDVFRAPVELGMALLPTEALGLDHAEPLDADFLERFLHLVELEGLYDRFDLLHVDVLPNGVATAAATSSGGLESNSARAVQCEAGGDAWAGPGIPPDCPLSAQSACFLRRSWTVPTMPGRRSGPAFFSRARRTRLVESREFGAFALQVLRLAGVAKLADAPDLGSGAARRGGSSPSARTRR